MKVENNCGFQKSNLTFPRFFTKHLEGIATKTFLNNSKKTSFS